MSNINWPFILAMLTVLPFVVYALVDCYKADIEAEEIKNKLKELNKVDE